MLQQESSSSRSTPTEAQVQEYQKNGHIRIPNLIKPSEFAQFREHMI